MATIDQLSAALVKADAAGNTEDAKAFADEIRKMQRESATPSRSATPEEGPVPSRFQTEVIQKQGRAIDPLAMIEGGLNIGSGMASSAVGGLAGIAGSLLPGPQGQGAEWSKSIQEAGTYQPRSEGGSYVARVLGLPVEVPTELLKAGESRIAKEFGYSPGREAIAENLVPILGTLAMGRAPVKSVATTKYSGTGIPNVIANAKAAGERGYTPVAAERASKVIEEFPAKAHEAEAVVAAKDLGIKLNPAETNPSKASSVRSTAAGGKQAMDAALALENLKVNVPNVARKELGIPLNEVITKDSFNKVREGASKPLQEISAMGAMTDHTGAVISSLEALRGSEIIGKQASRDAINALVDDAVSTVERGMTGKQIIENIRQHRDDARKVLKQDQLSIVDKDKAKASLGVANALESLVEQNLKAGGNTKLLNEYKKGRQLQAKSYTWEDAWNADTGVFDPMVIAKQTAGDSAITGATAKIGTIANNFPGAMSKPSATRLGAAIDFAKQHITKTGPLGVAGAALGSVMGPVGAAGGATLGMLAGEMLAPVMRKRILSEKGQAGMVPEVTSLSSPVNFNKPPSTAVVPYISKTEVVGEMPYQPNFTAGRPETPVPKITPTGVDISTPQLGYRTAREAVLEKEAARSAASKAAYEQQAARETAVPRKSTSGGMMYDLDPITGKLVPTGSGGGLAGKGASIDILEATGKSGKSAADKIREGRAFDLTAAERVVWSKSVLDGMPRAQGEALFGSLTDKQIATKMADRAYVEGVIKKAKQQEQMFNDIAVRSNDQLAKAMARVQREKMTDLLEQLQETLSSGRPSNAGKSQGPKTRAFQRGLLNNEGLK